MMFVSLFYLLFLSLWGNRTKRLFQVWSVCTVANLFVVPACAALFTGCLHKRLAQTFCPIGRALGRTVWSRRSIVPRATCGYGVLVLNLFAKLLRAVWVHLGVHMRCFVNITGWRSYTRGCCRSHLRSRCSGCGMSSRSRHTWSRHSNCGTVRRRS